MFRILLLSLLLVTTLFAQIVMAQDDGMMMDDSMKDEMMTGEFSAVISGGTARVRDRASLEGGIVGFCRSGNQFTVWLPATGDWLTSSCHGVNGFIHSSLVEIGKAVAPADDSMMMDKGMMDDGMMADKMMDDSMKDKMMDDSMKDEMMAGEFTAVINRGPARIRAGASLESEILGRCAKGDQLTVWLPRDGDWLTASCHNVNGYIHSSLVDVGKLVIPTITELGGSDGMAMKDDMSMDEM